MECPWPPILHISWSCTPFQWKSFCVSSLNLPAVGKPAWVLLWPGLMMNSTHPASEDGPAVLRIEKPCAEQVGHICSGGPGVWFRRQPEGELKRVSPVCGLWRLSLAPLALTSLPTLLLESFQLAIPSSLNPARIQRPQESPQFVTDPRQPFLTQPRHLASTGFLLTAP